jgi:hypothetical protein
VPFLMERDSPPHNSLLDYINDPFAFLFIKLLGVLRLTYKKIGFSFLSWKYCRYLGQDFLSYEDVTKDLRL